MRRAGVARCGEQRRPLDVLCVCGCPGVFSGHAVPRTGCPACTHRSHSHRSSLVQCKTSASHDDHPLPSSFRAPCACLRFGIESNRGPFRLHRLLFRGRRPTCRRSARQTHRRSRRCAPPPAMRRDSRPLATSTEMPPSSKVPTRVVNYPPALTAPALPQHSHRCCRRRWCRCSLPSRSRTPASKR